MRLILLAFLALQAAVVASAQISQNSVDRPAAMTVRFGSDAKATFKAQPDVVTDIDLKVSGMDYTVPLQCAGGLRDVHVETSEVHLTGPQAAAEGTFSLLFQIGNEQDKRFGEQPRVQISFYRRRVTDMLLTTKTSERSWFSSKLCATLPVGPVTCKDTRRLQGLPPEILVHQLRDLPTPIPAGGRGRDTEEKRRNIYEELLDWGPKSVPPLAAGLQDPDVRLRRNAAIAFQVLGGGWYPFECGPARIDITPALPALLAAFEDDDRDVRAWAAQAVGSMGAAASAAVPELIEYLKSADEGMRNSACIALGQIGPAAKTALPALRIALTDPSKDVRQFATRAIQRIEQQ